jgi:hypothetical protein
MDDVMTRMNLWRLALVCGARALEALVAISREELIVGGRAFYKSRPPSMGGLSTAWKLKPVKILEVARAGAKIEFENKKTIIAPFGMLEPDEGFLDEHERKEALKKKRIERERLLSEELCTTGLTPSAPLTYTLADKLSAETADDDQVASEADKREALTMLEALRVKDLANTAPPAPQHALFDELAARREKKQAEDALPDLRLLKVGGEPASTSLEAPEPEPAPEPSPKPPTRPPLTVPPSVPPAPEPEPEPELPFPPLNPPPPLTPMQRMLLKVQSELEQLIADEAELDAQTVDAERQLAHLESLLAATRPKLEANRKRQKVLAAQERMVLSRVQAEAVPAPAPAPAEAAMPAPQPPDKTLPPAVSPTPLIAIPKRRGRPPGSKNRPKVPETMREVYQAAEVASRPAPGTIAGPGPGWLRRRSAEHTEGAAE